MSYCVLVYVNMDARAEWCNICHTACSSMLIWMPGQSGVTYVILRAVYVNMDARAEWCNICHTACSSMLIWMPGQSGVTYVILRARLC